MAFAQASAVRGALRAFRPSRTPVGRARQWRQMGRRGYASHGHETKKASTDLPWIAGAVTFTGSACWYLISSSPNLGRGGHGDSHGKEHGDDHGEKHEGDESEAESESSDDAKSHKEGEDSDSGDQNKEADTPDTSDEEGDEDGKKNTAKDSSSSDAPATPKGNKKVIPDAKGGNKVRTDSERGKKQGTPEDMTDGEDSESEDKPAASKTAGNLNTQSGKQEGLSNTDTKHSTDLTNDPEKSKKGEGSPETAKTKGTVDPKRPQV